MRSALDQATMARKPAQLISRHGNWPMVRLIEAQPQR
jgi:hypothetical protein